jgi:hypothetical protein
LNQIAILENGRVAIIPNEPYEVGLVANFTTRRMNAGSLRADLLLHGLNEEAKVFWGEYERCYSEKVSEDRRPDLLPESELGRGIKALDVIGQFVCFVQSFNSKFTYVLIIF